MKNFVKLSKIFALHSIYAVKISFFNIYGTLIFLLGKLLRFFIFFFLIVFLLSKTETINGYSLSQILIFYLTFTLVDTISQILFREVYRFRSLIVSGDFNMILTKPIHPFVKILVGGIDILDILTLLIYIPLTIYIALKSIPFNIPSYFLYMLLFINGLIITTSIHIMVLALGIITTKIDHAIMIYRDVLSLGRFPIDIYAKSMSLIFTFIIPVGIVISYPARALSGLLSFSFVVVAFIIGFVYLFLSLLFWSYALKKYQSWGG